MQKENLLVKYFSRYLYKEVPPRDGGPIITISREYGCNALEIAEGIAAVINSKANGTPGRPKWNVVSKEILSRSAEELQTKPDFISHIFEGRESGFFEEVIGSIIRNYYVRNSKIIKTVKTVIRSYAWEGNAILIGRASCVVANDIAKSLHIKMIAPLDYRIEKIAAKYKLNHKTATEKVAEVDASRQAFLKFFIGDKAEYDFYDIVINRARLSTEEIIDIIMKLASSKGLI